MDAPKLASLMVPTLAAKIAAEPTYMFALGNGAVPWFWTGATTVSFIIKGYIICVSLIAPIKPRQIRRSIEWRNRHIQCRVILSASAIVCGDGHSPRVGGRPHLQYGPVRNAIRPDPNKTIRWLQMRSNCRAWIEAGIQSWSSECRKTLIRHERRRPHQGITCADWVYLASACVRCPKT